MATPYDIVRVGAVASTQDVAIEAAARTGRPTLVVAEQQLVGRGRQGRTWIPPDRGMFSSFATTTSWPPDRRTLIPLTVAVAVRRAIDDRMDIAVDTKWPNDLLLGGKKVGGVLVEAADERVTIGCGLNLWWPNPPEFAVALSDVEPSPDVAVDVATGWVDAFIELVEPGWEAWPRDEYEASCVTLGSPVEWEDGVGVATAIAPNGGLVIDTRTGPITVHHGDVHLSGQG